MSEVAYRGMGLVHYRDYIEMQWKAELQQGENNKKRPGKHPVVMLPGCC